ncbi:hypothetical protein OQA88_9141 [Cercophora sp. LCS_1]
MVQFSLSAQSGLGRAITLTTFLFSSLSHSLPAADLVLPDTPNNSTLAARDKVVQGRAVPDFYLRILPLGVSIVYGMGSSTGNGFRKALRDGLRVAGYKVNMVGNRSGGDMADNSVEATSGFQVHEVHAAAISATQYQPNVVLINAGNNDARLNNNLNQIGERMESLIDHLQQNIPGVTTLLSTMLVSSHVDITEERLGLIDAQYQHVAMRRRHVLGQKIILVDFSKPGTNWNIPLSLMPDGIHPNDEGYEMMAQAWYQGILETDRAGFLTAPNHSNAANDEAGSASNTCEKKFGMARGPITTQAGSGQDDGLYTHNSVARGVRYTIWANATGDAGEIPFVFARLNAGTNRHYIVQVLNENHPTNGGRYHRFFRPTDPGSWQGDESSHIVDSVKFWVPDGCIKRGARWADVNGDGCGDFLCVSLNGDTYYSINYGVDEGAVNPIVSKGIWKANQGKAQDRVRIADIDGDGRADYCIINDNGNIECWRNGGFGDAPVWQHMGVVSAGRGMGDPLGVRFADLNGDYREDWVWMDGTGKAWTWINNRGCEKSAGKANTPLWREASVNPTHFGMSTPNVRDWIHFANVYDSQAHFGGAPRADYVRIAKTDEWGGPDFAKFEFSVYQNTGSGGAKLEGDGARYCDMKGRLNGAQDLVWVHSTGNMRIYESRGGQFKLDPPYWGNNYMVWDISGSRQIDRRYLHLIDVTGDGACDIMYNDPHINQIEIWVNNYKQNNNFNTWTHRTVNLPNTRCIWDGNRDDSPVRWADLNGDGLGDLICLEKNGRAYGYINSNGGNTFTWHSQFKFSEGKERADITFADVDGDRKADMLWIEKHTGDTSVWKNMGPIPGAVQGHCTVYNNLDGNGRADMTVLELLTNKATTWFNECGDRGGDPNTHTTRAVIPAPEVDSDLAIILAARWSGRQLGNAPGGGVSTAHYVKVSRPINGGSLNDFFNWDASCNEGHKLQVAEGWFQLDALVKHQRNLFNSNSFDWGAPWNLDYFGAENVFTHGYRERVRSAFDRLADIGPDANAFTRFKLDVGCMVPDYGCNSPTGGYGAWVRKPEPLLGHNWPGMIFCNYFFHGTDDLWDAALRNHDDLDLYKNRGTVMMHELLHHHNISLANETGGWRCADITDVKLRFNTPPAAGGQPGQGDQTAYGTAGAKALTRVANETGVVWTGRNSDSYMLATLGSYLYHHGLYQRYPPLKPSWRKPDLVFSAKRRRSSNSTFFSNSTTYSNSTGDLPIILPGVATLYANGTVEMLGEQQDTGYFPVEHAPVVNVRYQDLMPPKQFYSPEHLALLGSNGVDDQPTALTIATTTATAASSPTPSPELAPVVEDDPWEGVVHCEVGGIPIECIAG